VTSIALNSTDWLSLRSHAGCWEVHSREMDSQETLEFLFTREENGCLKNFVVLSALTDIYEGG
jgi:hypothetical protein